MENNQAIQNRYDFVMLFDVENGNPNGDPDAGNLPRTDPETSLGLVTDVCLKRKIRNFVELAKADVPGYQILIRTDRPLNEKFTEAYDAEKLEKDRKKETPMSDQLKAQKYMCRNYYDVRTFGAVMSTGNNPCGIVRGPVQLNFARSIDPVLAEDITITRQAKTTIDRQEKGMTEIGKKSLSEIAMQYGYVYVAQIALGANMAQALKVIKEAEAYNGPSLIIGYAPCELHGIAKGGMNHCQDEMKKAVKAGYWNLFSFNPALKAEGKNPFTLTSKEGDGSYQEFLNNEARYTRLVKPFPERAERLFAKSEEVAKERYEHLQKLVELYK